IREIGYPRVRREPPLIPHQRQSLRRHRQSVRRRLLAIRVAAVDLQIVDEQVPRPVAESPRVVRRLGAKPEIAILILVAPRQAEDVEWIREARLEAAAHAGVEEALAARNFPTSAPQRQPMDREESLIEL